MNIVLVLEDLNDTGANRVSIDRAVHWQRRGETMTVLVTAPRNTSAEPVPTPPGLHVVSPAHHRHRLHATLPAA